MPAPLLIPAFLGLCKLCAAVGGTVFCVHKVAKAYEKGQKTKREKYALKGKSLEAAREDNKRLETREKELEDELKQGEQREKEFEKQISDIKKELDDPNISKEKEDELRNKLAFIQTQLDDEKKKNKTYREEKKNIAKARANNNRIISGVGLNTDDKHWIWDLFTLENTLILGGCYLLYKLIKDDKQR